MNSKPETIKNRMHLKCRGAVVRLLTCWKSSRSRASIAFVKASGCALIICERSLASSRFMNVLFEEACRLDMLSLGIDKRTLARSNIISVLPSEFDLGRARNLAQLKRIVSVASLHVVGVLQQPKHLTKHLLYATCANFPNLKSHSRILSTPRSCTQNPFEEENPLTHSAPDPPTSPPPPQS